MIIKDDILATILDSLQTTDTAANLSPAEILEIVEAFEASSAELVDVDNERGEERSKLEKPQRFRVKHRPC